MMHAEIKATALRQALRVHSSFPTHRKYMKKGRSENRNKKEKGGKLSDE